jgi:CubicO group peptidase (beta-lactamase class C family)
MQVRIAAFAAAAATAAVLATPAVASADQWDPLREGLDAWVALDLDVKFSLTIGTTAGRDFFYETSDGWTMQSPIDGASFSKWTTAAMIANMVADGVLAFDDPANKYLDFWAKDPKDPRSAITLESLLSLTSGFQEDADSVYICASLKGRTYLDCAAVAYNASKSYVAPRTSWTYLSVHHQFAGAMAVAASGKDVQTLLKEYLYTPFNMTHTSYGNSAYPTMAVAIVTNGNDVEQFLTRMLDYSGASKAVLDVVETDWTEPPVNLYPTRNYFGHYGLGHMWECFE